MAVKKNNAHHDGKQKRAIAALMKTNTVKEAAKECGISDVSIYHWLSYDADFQLEYKKACGRIVQIVIHHVARKGCRAADVLEVIMNSDKSTDAARVSAAKGLIDLMMKGSDINVMERIEAIENQLKTQGESGSS